jgi:hypothetical protein
MTRIILLMLGLNAVLGALLGLMLNVEVPGAVVLGISLIALVIDSMMVNHIVSRL